MIEHSYWILLLPLLSSLAIFFFGRWLPVSGAVIGILSVGYGLIHSLGILSRVMENPALVTEISYSWFDFGIFQTELGIMIDGLAAVMLLVVTLVSFLVHIYSLGYMKGDPRFKRYYAYLSFFTFSMLLLVVSNNFLQTFIGWELVGLSSYLLIGFWFEKPEAASAGRKAFMTTKCGDIGFFIGIMVIFSLLGTLNFQQVQGRIMDGLISSHVAGIIALLIFCGAIGKSAQVPLHVWLPDAMEGPTPVSALIHAATMVAAGVYLVARTFFIFEHGAFSLQVVAWIGGVTAFLAATMALVSNDIKRVLAFSTLSQLGYMMLALGVGGRSAAIFHLTTHAFFKALLFLCAGAVIHAVHTNDIREMGGLSKKMIWTFWAFSFSWAAISGIWPFAGFFSKDAILEAALYSEQDLLFWLGIFVAFMTSFYITRLYLLVFVTEPRNIDRFAHAREASPVMVIPLMVLAALSFGGGILFQSVWSIQSLVPSPTVFVSDSVLHKPAYFVPVVSLIASMAGIVFCFICYVQRLFRIEACVKTFRPLYDLWVGKYYFDELYTAFFVKPADALGRWLSRFDLDFYDRFGIDGLGWVTLCSSRLYDWFDRVVVDGMVDLWGTVCQRSGSLLRRVQTGLVQNYMLIFIVGFGLLVLWKLGIHF